MRISDANYRSAMSRLYGLLDWIRLFEMRHGPDHGPGEARNDLERAIELFKTGESKNEGDQGN